MTHAYDEIYLDSVRQAMGNMLHYAVYDMGWNINKFYESFIKSGVAAELEKASPSFAAGKSGIELANEVYYRVTGSESNTTPEYVYGRSPEFFAGWAIAYYSWYTSKSFREIDKALPINEVVAMYNPYHEMDISQFVIEVDSRMSKYNKESQLKRLRLYASLTQSELATRSGVSKRMIEQYEQGRKTLANASATTVIRLADVLNCDVRELV